MGRIRSVLVGVDVYERPDVPPLGGCVNDVALVRHVLKTYLGVPNEDIRVVVNHRATKENILHRLRVASEASEEGDMIVFYFSGHGSQIRDRDGDELTDYLDEVICPYDMDWDRGTFIIDDDLDALFAEIPEGVLLEAFVDCCFWGTDRDDVRFLVPPFDIAARAEGEADLSYHAFVECECFGDRNVLWAASEEGQPAAEDTLDGRTHGVFTYWGCRFIEANIDRIWSGAYSREHLLKDLREYVLSLGYPQHAQLTAPRPLLEVEPFTFATDWETAVRGREPRRRHHHRTRS